MTPIQKDHMKIHVDEAAPGSGKTYSAINRMISFPGRYLFVTERHESIRSVEAACLTLADQRGHHVRTWPIMEGTPAMVSKTSIREAVEALPGMMSDEHIIAIITHAAFLISDLTEFADWHLIVDEVPSVLSIDEVQTMKDASFFVENYSLTPMPDYAEWSFVGLTETGKRLTSRHLYQDDSHRHLRNWHSRVLESQASNRRRVVCNLTRWEQMGETEEREGRRVARQWIWGSLFSLTAMEAFETVTMLANRFRESLSFKLLNEAALADQLHVEWTFYATTRPQAWAIRSVRVHYFSRRRSSRYYFQSAQGRAHLAMIDATIAERLSATGIWTTNEALREDFAKAPVGQFQTPRLAGSNAFTGSHDAAIIYSAKPSPNIIGLLKTHGVTADDWTETNELETILQFVTRTSLRDPGSTAPVNVYVFDSAQALHVANHLQSLPHCEVKVVEIDLGLNVEEKKRGRQAKVLTPEEKAAKAEKKRDQKAAWARKTRAAAKGGAA